MEVECKVCKDTAEETRVRGLRVFTCSTCNLELRPNGTAIMPNYSAEESKRQTLAIIAETYADLAKEGREA